MRGREDHETQVRVNSDKQREKKLFFNIPARALVLDWLCLWAPVNWGDLRLDLDTLHCVDNICREFTFLLLFLLQGHQCCEFFSGHIGELVDAHLEGLQLLVGFDDVVQVGLENCELLEDVTSFVLLGVVVNVTSEQELVLISGQSCLCTSNQDDCNE